MKGFKKVKLPWVRIKKNKDDGLSSSQVKTLMAHIGTLTSICMVKPISDCTPEEKRKLRDSIKQREHVCFNNRNRYSQMDEAKENDSNNNGRSKKAPLKRISNIIESTSNILEYKDVLRKLSTQMFTHKNRPTSGRRGKRFSIVPPISSSAMEEFEGLLEEGDDEKTMNFVLTQKFIGWKV